jgi:uncharacterized membrane protein
MAATSAAMTVIFLLLLSLSAARADLKLCNRMSYVVEAALGLDDKGTTATSGWFRIDPAQCRAVLQGQLSADHVYLHARALPVYGASPTPQSGSEQLCVAADNFTIAAARQCRGAQSTVPFTEIKPTQGDDGNLVAYLAEDAAYDDEQARLAAIQRLLVIAGYDAAPIDGVDGPKTQAALAAFLRSQNLAADAVAGADFFTTMIARVQTPSATGLTWCNDTAHKVMAAIATDDGRTTVSRGWYRIEPGKCLHPDVIGQPRRMYSFAEAVDADGRAIRIGGKPLNWGGTMMLCTRETKFEINDQGDCAARGLLTSGFREVDLPTGRMLRFGMP